jgi:hypothetical protein
MANDQIARRDQGAQPSATPNVPALDFSKIDPAIMTRAAAIAADIMANGGHINAAQALAAAYHFEQTGEVIGRHAYVGTTGQVAGKVLEGYRGVARGLDMSQFQFRYRPLTDDEKKMHDIDPKWQTVACEIDVLKARARCIRMHIEYQPVIGIGILKPSEKVTSSGQPKDPPKTKTWYWVLQKRSRVDGMRQLGENTSGDDVLEEADVEAPEGAHLTIGQAEAFVREHFRKLNAPERTPEEAKRLLAENVTAMRGDPQDDPFADKVADKDEDTLGPPPPTDDDDQSTENERQGDEQPVARPSSNGNTPHCPVCGGGMWDNQERKASGQMKPNAPDYKCKDKECEGKYWPGQWPPKTKPTDDQMAVMLELIKAVYPKKEDKTKFKGWFANTFPQFDTSAAKSVNDLLNMLVPVQADTCIASLETLHAALDELAKDSGQTEIG